MKKYLLALLHNLVMIFFVILIAYNRSFENQVLISIIASVYWIVGYVLIYGEKKS
jgi:hypothetical protein